MQMLKETKMKKNIKESSAFSFSPDEPSQLVNGSYNISKVEDPIELKRLNNYITTVLASGPFQSRKDTLNQLRLKLNLLGFDIDIPRSLRQNGQFNLSLPLKRFGGITGMDDQGKKLDNPYGPGVKLELQLSSMEDFMDAKIVPAAGSSLPDTTPVAPSPEPVAKEEPKPVKEGFSISNKCKARS
jgi:hypothetical protein